MAAFLYDEGRRSLGGFGTHSNMNLDDDAFSVFFNDDNTDAPSQTADQDAADVTANNPTFANAPALAPASNRCTISSSVLVFDGTDLAFTGSSVLTGSTSVESVIIFKDSGTNTTSPLLSRHDDYTGLPLTPSGGDVTIVWAATGILRF